MRISSASMEAGSGTAAPGFQSTVSPEQTQLIATLATGHCQRIVQSQWSAWLDWTSRMTALWPQLLRPTAADDWRRYCRDALERSVLVTDTLRKRGDGYLAREAHGDKPVLAFDYDLIMDGRSFERPVNYALVRIRPPWNFPIRNDAARPFVIIDPRAGHGSGIGGFKEESEVGVALRDGHPVYFVVFYPMPEPGQTLADVTEAEARFLAEVRARHPKSAAPLVIGNCQGGWAAMILAALHPDMAGPVVIAGAPLSYWAGSIGRNPLRYFGGLAGGAVPALLAADLGAGKFDGAALVLNFEQLNPAKTWWRKYYDLFAEVDRHAGDFLAFERWWTGFYFLNESEIRWIVETLFVGNKLTRGEARFADGRSIDLKQIKAPIIAFASHGDNISPPQQALQWIADLYRDADDIRAAGRVIIYTLHDSVGHLGIFVSDQVASREHRQIASVADMVETLPPGLYELKIEETTGGKRSVSFEAREIADILALGDGRRDEPGFAAAAELSEWGVAAYERTLRPWVQACTTPAFAETLKAVHPVRLREHLFSGRNPAATAVAPWAEAIRTYRRPVSPDNPFLRLERLQAAMIEQSWNVMRDVRDAWVEMAFHGIYGSPVLRALGSASLDRQRLPAAEPRELPQASTVSEDAAAGGFAEAVVRILILLAKARGSVRSERLERSRRLLMTHRPFATLTPEEQTRLVFEQSLVVEFAPASAIGSLATLLREPVDRRDALDLALQIAGPLDDMDPRALEMFGRIESVLLSMTPDAGLAREPAVIDNEFQEANRSGAAA